jgi:hypothetical protein
MIFRYLLFILLGCQLSCALSQSCEQQIDLIYTNSTADKIVSNLKTLSNPCKSHWYNYRLGLAQFQTNSIAAAFLTTSTLVDSMLLKAKLHKSYIIRTRAAILVYLFMEESRRLKDKKQFNNWKNKLKKLRIKDVKCGNGHHARIKQVIQIMKMRFEFTGNTEWFLFYERKEKRLNGNGRYWKKFLY